MAYNHRVVKPSRIEGTVLSENGERLIPPQGWEFLPAGDAAITKSVKAKGETWVVQMQKGKRLISQGIWANKTHILSSINEVEKKRSTPEYLKRRNVELARREIKQNEYVEAFFTEVIDFLDFHSRYQKEAILLAETVTNHATPVGSGTVARTARIPIAKRAEAAVLAWMRHQTTAYESMTIARIKGRRREIRKLFVRKSIEILDDYRRGREVAAQCPLKKALIKISTTHAK